MINPRPIRDAHSPYSAAVAVPDTSLRLPNTLVEPKPLKKRWKKILLFFVLLVFVGVGAYGAALYRSITGEVITQDGSRQSEILKFEEGSSFNAASFKKLGDGRFTMVLLGIDKAAGLTDTIQVVSIDTINKTSTTISVPRDLYVNVPGYGKTKINATYKIGEARGSGQGQALLKQVLEKVLGTTVTNFGSVNFDGLKDLVNAVGGIDINVPKAIVDPYFPADTGDGYKPFSITTGPHHMDGTLALRYARSRETTSDFDRAARQQLVIQAIKDKAFSMGVIANPVKLTNIISALGKNARTDLQTDEIKLLLNIYKAIPKESQKTYILDTSDDLGLLTSSSGTAAGYISYPRAGSDNYEDIHAWYRSLNPDPLLAREKPTVTLYNGASASTKEMNAERDALKAYGFSTTLGTSGTSTKSGKSISGKIVIASGDKKPISANYIKSLFPDYDVSVGKTTSGSDIEVTYVPSKATNTPSPSPSTLSSQSKRSPSPSPSPKD